MQPCTEQEALDILIDHNQTLGMSDYVAVWCAERTFLANEPAYLVVGYVYA